MRVLAPFMAIVFALVTQVPSLYVLQFQLRKSYIERELCVQRDVMEDKRTCHGECQLSKKFKALEEEAQKGFPHDRLEVRHDPLIELVILPLLHVGQAVERTFPVVTMNGLFGHRSVSDPVPWC